MRGQFWESLAKAGIDVSAASEAALLLLPERILTGQQNDLRDAQDSLDLAKYAKARGVPTRTAYDFGISTTVRLRHSNEIWLGVLAFLGTNVALSIAINVVSSYIYDRLKNRAASAAEPLAHVTLIVVRGETSSQIEYVGELSLLGRVLQSIPDGSPEPQSADDDEGDLPTR